MEAWGYDGSSWREATELWVYDGSTWRDIQEGWVYDGGTWRKFWEVGACTASLDSASVTISDDGASPCGTGKCYRTISWTYTDAGFPEHIAIHRSTNGGSYLGIVDNRGVGTFGSGSYQDDACPSDGTSTVYRVRLESDPGDTLACGDASNQITTNTVSACSAPV